MLLYFALNYSERDLRWYVLDPGGAFQDFAALPHSTDVFEPQQRNIVSGLDEQELQSFIRRFDRAAASDTSRHRPPVLLVIDDYDELAQRISSSVKPQFDALAQQAIRGRANHIYLALSAAKTGFNALPTSMISSMATRIVLYMGNRDNMSAVLGGRVPFAPDPVPGRGFAQTRSSLDEIQIAAPTYGATELDRVTALQAALARIREQTY
jgi:DNA segregation ATPase FtsK/SpoIIIE-like protein